MATPAHGTPLTVMGGGIAGCLAAWRAHRAGYAVTLYEPHGLGSGASGQALGILVPSTATRPLDEYQRQGCARWVEVLAPELAADAGVPLGTIFRPWPRGGQLNLPEVFKAFTHIFAHQGVEVRAETAPAEPKGLTLWAAGWGNAPLLPGMTIRAGTACRLTGCTVPELLVGEAETQGMFALPTWDGAVLLGTHNVNLPAPHTGPVPAEWLEALLAKAPLLHPNLAHGTVESAWVGNRPTTSPRLPLLRPLGPQSWAVAGLGGLGFALSPMVAEAFLQALPSA